MDAPYIDQSRLGLVYRISGRLKVGHKLGICVGDVAGSLSLHLEDGMELNKTVQEAGSPTDDVPDTLSPASRLILGVERSKSASRRIGWSEQRLLECAGGVLAPALGARRMAANEALRMGWSNIFEWLSLSPTEKAWVSAHEAALHGRPEQLLEALNRLPPTGYRERVRLLVPHLHHMGAESATWMPLVESWREAQLPLADLVYNALATDWSSGIAAGVTLLSTLGADETATAWEPTLAGFNNGRITIPLVEDARVWAAGATYFRGSSGEELDPAAVATLKPAAIPLLDDLVDQGALSAASDLSGLTDEQRIHVTARVAADRLSEAQLRSVGHTSELARRHFQRHDAHQLGTLSATPAVIHYQALLDVVRGGRPDQERIRHETYQLLGLVDRAKEALKSGASRNLPPPILDDATLWPLFADEASRGDIEVGEEVRDRFEAFSQWADLRRIVGLLWEGEWAAAVRLSDSLSDSVRVERYRDEALNLGAFARDQIGDLDGALRLLEDALDGEYTEALLINTSIIAAKARPEVAFTHFARLVREAPSPQLMAVAMSRAIRVWDSAPSQSAFPDDLVQPLRDLLVMESTTLEDYAKFARIASLVARSMLLGVPQPTGEKVGPYRLLRARAKLIEDDRFGLDDVAIEFAAVHKAFGETDWFQREWNAILELVREATFVDFGQALGPAAFWDTLHTRANHLMSDMDRLTFLPQAGAHLAAMFESDASYLSEDAFAKFFFRPAEELISSSGRMEEGLVDHLARNLSRTLFIALKGLIVGARSETTDPYNALVARLRWDHENVNVIRRDMRRILDLDTANIRLADRGLDRLRRLPLADDDHRERIRLTDAVLEEWRGETARLRSDL